MGLCLKTLLVALLQALLEHSPCSLIVTPILRDYIRQACRLGGILPRTPKDEEGASKRLFRSWPLVGPSSGGCKSWYSLLQTDSNRLLFHRGSAVQIVDTFRSVVWTFVIAFCNPFTR